MIRAVAACLAAALASAPVLAAWIEVDYSPLVDRRQLSHSGESVGVLLERLAGRAPSGVVGESAVRSIHALLDPLVEPYAFVLPDALDAIVPSRGAWIEIAGLWTEGERQPAWVELARARRYVVESDGAGRMRVFVPAAGESAAAAWEAAWPVLRHAIAGERSRLGASADGESAPIEITAFPYRHEPARGILRLGLEPHVETVTDTGPQGARPPLDFDRLAAFLESGLRLEGARLDDDGTLRLLGSRDDAGGLLGRAVTLADLAVAYRAVARGGLAEPYMSLDRGASPQTAVVNYGGRLRDTALGWVSLLCDIRFKTFSLGLDVRSGTDRRAEIRASLPEFRSHLERFAAHPDSLSVAAQQTRLWFYPDAVDLTLSPQGDILVMRRVRMSAASERVQETGVSLGDAQDPPWTKATVDAINNDYARLAALFPELGELDVVVRLLSLFTWLRQAEIDGRLVPELDALLAVELPALPTPRTYPQMLAFNALPSPGSDTAIEVFDRVEVGAALDRLDPAGLALPAHVRFVRALSALDRSTPEQAALLAELEGVDPLATDPDRLDVLTFRAERLRMHRLVLATLAGEPRERVAGRMREGEELRVFSVGIGGIDLGMGRALERAQGRRLGGDERTGADVLPAPRTDEPRQAWRRDPSGMVVASIPDHGSGRTDADHVLSVEAIEGGGRRISVLLGADRPDVRGRTVLADVDGRAVRFVRVEGENRLVYAFERSGERLKARRIDDRIEPASADSRALEPPPPGLGLLTVRSSGSRMGSEGRVPVRLEVAVNGVSRALEAELERSLVQRAVLGPTADLYAGQPIGGLAPLPPMLEDVETVMIFGDPARWEPPWSASRRLGAGDEDPERVGRGLSEWWTAGGGPSAVAGFDRASSMARWGAAARPSSARLWLPRDAFADPRLRDELVDAWGGVNVVERAEDAPGDALVVLVSAEPVGTLARRLRSAASGALRGRLLAVWSLAGPLRSDLPARLVGDGGLSGLGVGDPAFASRRRVVGHLRALSSAFEGSSATRVERRPGPVLWIF